MTSNLFSHSIVEVLKTFTKEEIQDFKLFLDSPYFNKQIVIRKLYAELIRFYPDFDNKKFTEENLISFISPNNKKTTLFDALSILLNKAQTFLSINQIIPNDIHLNTTLLGVLKQRELIPVFEKCHKTALKDNSKTNITAEDFFYNSYEIDNLYFNFLTSSQNILTQIDLKMELDCIDSSMLNLVSSFVLRLISLYLDYEFLSYNHDLSLKKHPAYKLLSLLNIKRLLDELRKFDDRNYIFETYAALLDMYSNPKSAAKYLCYKKLAEKNTNNFKDFELSFHYSFLICYFTLKLNKNQNDKKSIDELFKLYDIFLEKKLYRNKYSTHIPVSLFRNIFLFFINNKKFDNAINFVNNFTEELDKNQRENMRNYCLAYYYYVNDKFDKSLEHLLEIQTDYFFYKFDVKNLLLKNYYEIGSKYTDDAYRLIERYRQFLTINKMVSSSFRKTYKEFIDYYEKLLSYKNGNEKIDLGYLKKGIEANNLLFSRNWLLRKIGELEGAQKKRKKSNR